MLFTQVVFLRSVASCQAFAQGAEWSAAPTWSDFQKLIRPHTVNQMSLVADFRVFNDHSQHLKAGQQTVFRVEIPVNLDHTAGSSKSVVYLKYSLEGASSLKWELFLNGTLLLWTTSSGSKISMTMEAFEAKLLLPGENEFVFRVPSGTGTVRVADATVHYHVNV